MTDKQKEILLKRVKNNCWLYKNGCFETLEMVCEDGIFLYADIDINYYQTRKDISFVDYVCKHYYKDYYKYPIASPLKDMKKLLSIIKDECIIILKRLKLL